MPMKLLMLTRYSLMGSSSRVRFFQYIPYLQSLGWTVDASSFLGDSYLQQLYGSNKRSPILILTSYVKRIVQLLKSTDYDVLWIEKELMQWVPAWLEAYILRKYAGRYIIDYDDAIFHNYDLHRNAFIKKCYGEKIKKMMAGSYCVLAGNEYIAEYARAAGASRIEIIPSVVDMNRYIKEPSLKSEDIKFSIGWIGSPSTAKYMKIIENPLRLLAEGRNIELCVIGSNDAPVSGFPVRYLEWSEDTEVENVGHFDVGIMPLLDSPWERGKCGFKLIQYMACGKPVIASPVGVNSSIVEDGFNGYLAELDADWVRSLKMLYEDRGQANEMGLRGRICVEEHYSLQVTAPRIQQILAGLVRDFSEK